MDLRPPRIDRSDRALSILNGAVFGVTIISGAVTAILGEVSTPLVIVAAVVLAGIYVWIDRSRGVSDYQFAENSQEMTDFFSSWYARSGDYWIFCDDLDWMDGPQAATLRGTLLARPQSVTIALREHRGQAFQQLRDAGIRFAQIPAALSTHAKFSVHRHDGNRRMIIRLKDFDPESGRIAFRSTTDEFFIDMALDLIKNNCPLT